MKVSINWLKEYTDIDLSAEELVEKIGAQLGGVEEVVDLGRKYQGIIIAKVVSCEKHPNADKLSLCKIDDNAAVKDLERDKNGHIQVVCGAPNVAEGMLVAWLPPGITVPATFDKDPLILEARDIRGQVSNGMLASASELALSDDHAGILEINPHDAKPGDSFSDAYKLNDHIIDIENKMFTHRPDLFGILGIAREIAGIQHKAFNSPEWYIKKQGVKGSQTLPLEIKVEDPNLVPRFMAAAMSIDKYESPVVWLQTYLSRAGIRPINTVVDITNYLMHLTGQPLHAYDYDKVRALSGGTPMLVARNSKKSEKLRLLGGKEVTFDHTAIVIATDKKVIGIGGVMGGADTEVDKNTKNIILEVANFDMYSIRRTAMHYGLFTDAVTRFTKGQSALQNDRVITKAIDMVEQLANGKMASTIIDVSSDVRPPIAVHTSAKFINSRLGFQLDIKEMANLLRNVEFEVAVNGPNLMVTPPFWRTDIMIPEDIVEEIGRLYGYDHLPLDLPKRSLVPVGPDAKLMLKTRLRSKLAGLGANEMLTYSFVHSNLIEKTDQDKSLAFRVSNALSPDLQYYRLSLTPSLLDKVHMNTKAGYSEFAIFEIGTAHVNSEFDNDGLPIEFDRVALLYTSVNKEDKNGSAYYVAKKYLEDLTEFNIIPFDEKLLNKHNGLLQMAAPYDPKRSGLVWNGNYPVGIVGEFKASAAHKLKLPIHTAGFELFLSALSINPIKYQPLSKFPSTSQDITFKISKGYNYSRIYEELREYAESASSNDVEITIEPLDIFQADKAEDSQNLTFRITAVSHTRTLVTGNLSEILANAAEKLSTSIGAQRI